MVAAVDRIGEIDPVACRRRAMDFSAERMCAGYEAAYVEMLRRPASIGFAELSAKSA